MTALQALAGLPIRPAGPLAGYTRAQYGPAWADVRHLGCDEHNQFSTRDLAARVDRPGTHDCVVTAGTLADPYTGGPSPSARPTRPRRRSITSS